MDNKNMDAIESKDKILNAFRPIENIFKIMDTSAPEVYGELTQLYSEIGNILCKNFRNELESVLFKNVSRDIDK
ncbi:hypothetical protein [Solidesulfovibrio sp. C21]|uniref:hypothetical protein n=1 Tax=Solidesulfovibrio sp. C21 TaxID=3398613 RepID=UPI0039FD08F1